MPPAPLPSPEVVPADAAQAAAARELRLRPGQARHAGDIAFNVGDALASPDSEAMVVLLGTTVIGFYRLDYLRTVVARQVLDRRTMTLRAFALDRRWQGRGLGLPALLACCADLARRHPDRRLLALNVDRDNHAARRVYARAGFVDAGEDLPGGSGGPQRLLLRALGVGQ
ncbi:GNAT family N-acetyltransferase [Luteimonas sp. BDR2-5]|uniref:GNAT family N-acetyltransferase n=1 Tax=Proluteimonas luteida TaxID=2878685 RepID=UPI001E630C94|nr:GNAT family N-acetyltransferase [Luteimonas sp. BDR2-5]MCD9028045.1 GNAT family N-acetyltransferase [Luteimonas sp. BDR2-5]